jgi:hypothetical protein
MATDQDKKDELRRKRSLKLTKERLKRVLSNGDGIRRLRAISDEEWQAAVDADAGEEEDAAP